MTPSPASSTPHHAWGPPSLPPPSALGRPRGRKKGAKEAEVRAGRPVIGASPRPRAQKSARPRPAAPVLQIMPAGNQRLGPAGRPRPPLGDLGLPTPSSLPRGRGGGGPGPWPSASSSLEISSSWAPSPLLSLVLGAQPPPPSPLHHWDPGIHTHHVQKSRDWTPVISQPPTHPQPQRPGSRPLPP